MRYLETIGFSTVEGLQEEEKLISQMTKEPKIKQGVQINERIVEAECFTEVAPDTGIIVRGEYQKDSQMIVSHYFPAHIGHTLSMKERVMVNKRTDADAYTIMCDDYRLGVTMIFYLQNKADMLTSDFNPDEEEEYEIYLSGMSNTGKILLPIEGAFVPEKVGVGNNVSGQLFEQAKEGNEVAIENLAIDEIDKYAIMNKRVKNEDVYSIVNTTFLPCGTESDNYSVLGYITDVKVLTNSYTKEKMYLLTLSCNDVLFEVCINTKNLIGEPLPGRRFKGNVWMQGYVGWRKENE